jgi:hypothetical protein
LRQLRQNRETFGSIIEPDAGVANLGVTTKQPFDIIAEGLFLKESGEDRTPIELFIAGVRGWEVGLRRRLDDGTSSPR